MCKLVTSKQIRERENAIGNVQKINKEKEKIMHNNGRVESAEK